MAFSTIIIRSDMKVSYLQHMGSDSFFAAAARQSSQQRLADLDELELAIRDEKLINKLMPQRHTSPFEHSGLTVAVEVPLFVSREWERHRTQAYSEMSMRYTEALPRFWIPSQDHGVKDVGTKMKPKRSSSYDGLVQHDCEEFLLESYEFAWKRYEWQLQMGVHQEVARAVLPMATYTQFWATANAINWLRFLSLRTHEEDAVVVSYPQWEIEQAARQVERIFESIWPMTYEAWVKAGRVL